jgi:phospholipid/cholesterol/gamma-HCH transport system permease protein
MLPILTVVAIASGLLGAFIMALHFGVSGVEYMSSVQRLLGNDDFFGGIAKALVFGLIIAIVGCRQGLRTTGGAAGVGRATISSVVLSIVLIYVTNLFLTASIFGR